MQDNTKTVSGSIDHFFTAKSTSSETVTQNTLPGTSHASGSVNKQSLHQEVPRNKLSNNQNSSKTEHMQGTQSLSANKEKPRTLEAFFSSPKRKRAKASHISSPEHPKGQS